MIATSRTSSRSFVTSAFCLTLKMLASIEYLSLLTTVRKKSSRKGGNPNFLILIF
jgi:hypothetical protein